MIVGHIGGGSVGGYQVQRSVRLRAGNAANFSRTPGSAGNKKTITYSLFTKLGSLSSTRDLLTCGGAASNFFYFAINSSDQIVLQCITGSTEVARFTAPANRRDPNAWYHIVLSVDTAQASGANGMRLWVNGEQQTITVTTYLQNSSLYINEASQAHYIGRASLSAGEYFDGYLTEVNFIDGQALTPTSFAEQDTTTRMWVPKKYVGTYGNNGFYLDFSDITSTTTLGYDKSGNSNNWTANNISLTSGVTYDSMLDVPGLPWADGGNGRGNYCVVSPLQGSSASGPSDGNLVIGFNTNQGRKGTIAVTTGKWYWECSFGVAFTDSAIVGVSRPSDVDIFTTSATGYGYLSAGFKANAGSGVSYGATFGISDVIGVAFDATAGAIEFYKNGVSQGTAYTGMSGEFVPAFCTNATGSTSFRPNFGQRPFAYTPPTGFKALNTANLPDPTGAAAEPWEHFEAVTFIGSSSGGTVTGSVFKPDLVWMKRRSAAANHELADSVRGTPYALFSNLTNAEVSDTRVSAFNSDGFSYGVNSNMAVTGAAGVSWLWKAGGTAVSNTAGSITSQVSANTAAGFSIVTYTGTGANATVGHGLGVAPKMVIAKKRNGISDFVVYHSAIGANAGAFLNLTSVPTTSPVYFNNTSPTSSVLSIGTAGAVNDTSTSTHVAYCFAEVPGFSKFGSYTGNGSSDGPFVFCGFRPRWILRKGITTAGVNWTIIDTSRNTSNVANSNLLPNDAAAESSSGDIDITSTGFKPRSSSFNASGETYIYAAFAEAPFKYANAR